MKEWYADPIAAFGPSLETGNPDHKTWFIPMHPADIINKGEINEVPWILGFNSDEGFEHSLTIFKTEKLLKELNQNWAELFPFTLEYPFESEATKSEITHKVRDFYLKNQPICEQNLKNLSNVKRFYLLTVVVNKLIHFIHSSRLIQTKPTFYVHSGVLSDTQN